MRRTALVLLAFALGVPLALTTAGSAGASTTATSSCTDGGKHLWRGRAVWGAGYTDQAGVRRVVLSAAGFTSAAPDATTVDYSVQTYDAAGHLVQTMRESNRRFDFARGTVQLNRNPRNPPSAPGRAKVVISVGDGNDGYGNCTMTFLQPRPAPPPTSTPSPPAPTGSPSDPLNRSPNPVLATHSHGYSIQEGGTNLQRVSVADHVAASSAARVIATGNTTRIKEPRVAVVSGQKWTFASDVKAEKPAKAQVTVSWYSKDGTFVSWSGGAAQPVSGAAWTRVASTLPVPANATIAETVVNVLGTVKSGPVLVTQHDVRAPAATKPTPPPILDDESPAIRNRPAQAAGIIYGPSSGAQQYAHPGGLVVAGRDNYQGQGFKNVSAAGGSVLMYLDAIIDNPYGRYHALLNQRSECGPATSRWPGNYRANSWGYLNDFRVGSVLQDKFECVLNKMVAENPQMAGWFADDLGSRSWFPGIDWGAFPDRAAYRAGAVALTKTLRKVADEHGLIFLVNGTWSAHDGGGYPDPAQAGTALADGGFVEHHDGELAYFGPYGCSAQWAEQSPITRGKAFNYAVTYTAAGRRAYADSNCYAYVNQQSDYGGAAFWGQSHPTGLPSRVRR